MITFFTTFRKLDSIEENSIRSWLQIHADSEVLLYTEQENVSVFDGRVRVFNEMKVDPTGLPLLNYLFEDASKKARHNLLCYCNSDIILIGLLVNQFQTLANLKSPFLAVSQRTDLLVNYSVDLSVEGDLNRLMKSSKEIGRLQPPHGSDIFFFPKGQYSVLNMPNLVVGRPGWDNWMFYDARNRFNALIDLKASNLIIHQDHPIRYDGWKPEFQVNYVFLPEGHVHTFNLNFCNYSLIGASVASSYFMPSRKFWTPKGKQQLEWEIKFNRGLINLKYRIYLLWVNFYLFIKEMKAQGSQFIRGIMGVANH